MRPVGHQIGENSLTIQIPLFHLNFRQKAAVDVNVDKDESRW